MVKTKVVVCGNHLNMLKKSGCFPCGVCFNGVDCNSIFVKVGCGMSGGLKKDPSFRCSRCRSTAQPVDGRKITEIQMVNDKLEVVTDFCYLGDMISAGEAANFLQSPDASLLGVSFVNFFHFSPILIYFSQPEVKSTTRTLEL